MSATPTTSHPSRPAARMMKKRHKPLMRQYEQDPTAAWITDGARTAAGSMRRNDPVHGELVIGTSHPIEAPLSVHSAVGGDHDGPNPGDYLSAALAGCFDTTLRIIADRMGIVIEELSVCVDAEVDVRGTLCIRGEVPVGFQKMTIRAHVRPAPGTPRQAFETLIAATEHCCVVLQTLRGGVDVALRMDDAGAQPAAAGGSA